MSIISDLNSGTSGLVPMVEARLIAMGWTQSQVDQAMPYIEDAIKVDLEESDIDELVTQTRPEAEAHVTNIYSQMIDMEVNQLAEFNRDGYVVQNAIGRLIQPEPKSPSSSAGNLPDSTFSVDQDNPDSYNFVDDVKNWFKINKKTRTVEALLANGALIKLDGSGDTTIYTPGSVKQIIKGNYTVAVGGDMEVLVGGSKTETISDSKTETISGGSKTETVSGSSSYKSASTTFNSGSAHTISAGMIYLG